VGGEARGGEARGGEGSGAEGRGEGADWCGWKAGRGSVRKTDQSLRQTEPSTAQGSGAARTPVSYSDHGVTPSTYLARK
jgi:hypothetical protein